MISTTCEATVQTTPRGWVHRVALVALAVAVGCASTPPGPQPRGHLIRPDPSLRLPEDGAWTLFEVVRNGRTKKVKFREVATSRTRVMKYKGISTAWGSPVNLLVDEGLYAQRWHRVRYRFEHPMTGQPLLLRARSTSHDVLTLPIRPRAGTPSVEVVDRGSDRPVGHFAYDGRSLVLLAGDLGGRAVEVEEVDPDARRPEGVAEYVLVPFPLNGEFVIRVGGREAGRFVKRRQRGFVSPYELAIRDDGAAGERYDAVLAFVVFDLMGDFVEASVE